MQRALRRAQSFFWELLYSRSSQPLTAGEREWEKPFYDPYLDNPHTSDRRRHRMDRRKPESRSCEVDIACRALGGRGPGLRSLVTQLVTDRPPRPLAR